MKQDLEPTWPMLTDDRGFSRDVMSNFDHEIDREVEQILCTGAAIAKYPGRNFCGYCWFSEDQFHCAVYVYHERKAIVSADTLEELMRLVSNNFGWD